MKTFEIKFNGTAAFWINYPNIVASMNNFSADIRTHPIEYTDYEDVDNYETTVHIELPKGTQFRQQIMQNLKCSLRKSLKQNRNISPLNKPTPLVTDKYSITNTSQ